MDHTVEVSHIFKDYGSVRALRDVSFKVREGEFYALLGPSGCGKTTILRILGGFIEQDSGEVFIDGKDMKGIPPNLRNTSMVFQDLALFPHMDVRENIVYGLKKKKTPRDVMEKRFKRMVDILGLSGFEARQVSQLSGGQQQRVALARSLILEPGILLLDEPLASLDKKLRIAMQDELKDIQRKVGTTFLYVTHDQGEALTMSDTIAVMNEGRIVQTGSPDHIYDHPDNIFTADFIGAGNFIPLKSVKNQGSILELFTEKKGSLRSDCSLKEDSEKGDAIFFIRPEKVKMGRGSGKHSNTFSGKVVSSVFEGPDIRLEIEAPELGMIKVEIKNDGTPHRYQKNDNIAFHWDYNDGMVICS